MAAIDKMYLNDWYAFDRLVRWSICHFPSLLNYFYDWRMTYADWADAEKEYVESVRKINERDLEKIGGKDVSLRNGIYDKSAGKPTVSTVGWKQTAKFQSRGYLV